MEWWGHHTVSTTAVVDSGQWSGGSTTQSQPLLSWTVDSGVVGAPHSLNHCCRGQWTVEWWEHHTVSTTAVVDSGVVVAPHSLNHCCCGQWSGGSTTQSQPLLHSCQHQFCLRACFYVVTSKLQIDIEPHLLNCIAYQYKL